MVKNPPANAGDRDIGLMPGSVRSPGGGHGNPLQYSCLENPMDRGAWWATVHRVTKSWTRLKRLSMHACTHIRYLNGSKWLYVLTLFQQCLGVQLLYSLLTLRTIYLNFRHSGENEGAPNSAVL